MQTASEMPEWKAIRTMSDRDLENFLENNDKIDPHLLAIVCSEVLRRNARRFDELLDKGFNKLQEPK